jgi:hypothetical protein
MKNPGKEKSKVPTSSPDHRNRSENRQGFKIPDPKGRKNIRKVNNDYFTCRVNKRNFNNEYLSLRKDSRKINNENPKGRKDYRKLNIEVPAYFKNDLMREIGIGL